jgi:hypothetical protein
MPKSTPEQIFAKCFNLANDEAALQPDRDSAERKMAAWLKRHGKNETGHSGDLGQGRGRRQSAAATAATVRPA